MNVIAAVSMPKRVIGRDGGIPWNLSEDLRRFKTLTEGGGVIMGRKTYSSIGRALPKRLNVVVTSSAKIFPGCMSASSAESAASYLLNEGLAPERIWFIGGERIYAEALTLASTRRVYLTEIALDVVGDAHFPALPEDAWRLGESSASPTVPGVSYSVYERTTR